MKRKATGDESTVVHKNVVYEKWNDDNGAEFFFPVSKIEDEEPIVRWSGGKIPWASWVNLCAFCELVSEKESSECQFQLFYSDSKKNFHPWAFPQKKKSGMVTKELNEHPDFIKQLHAIREMGYYPFGTLHTHDKMGAFQSSTDHSDEKESEGLHITLGKISRTEQYDIHSRFTAKRPGYENEKGELVAPSYVMLPVEWTDFIEAPDSIIADRLPSLLKKKILETVLLRPDISTADESLLETWMKNRIEEKVEPTKHFGTGPNGYQMSHPWRRHGNWTAPTKNWLTGDTTQEKGSAFPDYEPGASNHTAQMGGIDYTSSGPINDPDCNEDYFMNMKVGVESQTEFFPSVKNTVATDLQQELIKDDLIAFCELHELETDTLLDLLVDGSKMPENADLLRYLQEELEEQMEEIESNLNIKIGYPEIMEALEEIQVDKEARGKSPKQGKTKNAIVKRKKLKHTLHSR